MLLTSAIIFSEADSRAKSVTDLLNLQPCLVFTPDEDNPGAATIVCKVCADYRAEMRIYSAAGIVVSLEFRWLISTKT